MLINNEIFENQARKILQKWSGQINLSESNNLCYFFCFRQLKKVYPFIKEKDGKGNKDRIWKLARIIFDLLDYERPPEEYAFTLNNRICIDWKNEDHSIGNNLKDIRKAFKL